MNLFKTNTSKDYSKQTRVRNVYCGRMKKETKNNKSNLKKLINNVRNIFRLKKKTKQLKTKLE